MQEKKEAVDILLDGLESLEYRGYDSAGVAVVSPQGKLQVRKSKGRLSVLRTNLTMESPLSGKIGIGIQDGLLMENLIKKMHILRWDSPEK